MSIYKNTISKLFTKISFGVILIAFFCNITTGFAQIIEGKKIFPVSKKTTDFKKNSPEKNILAKQLNTISKDSTRVKSDTIQKSGTLKGKITHFAEDYTEVNNQKKYIKLYNKAHIHYEDIDLTAGVIYIDYAKKEVYAGRILDSLGKLSQRPVFKQGNTETENDSIRFNFETKKALVWNTYTREGEFGLVSEVSKKYNDSIMFVKNVKFTTSKDLEHPEYYFLAKKAKIVPGKKIVIGTTQMWIEDVATPVVIPFGFFPLTTKRTSGFILPSFADSRHGFSLTGGGFYWAMSPYADLKVTGDIFTDGSYLMSLSSNYKKRYKFGGNFAFRYNNDITLERGLEGYQKNISWNIMWHHSKDAKSSPLSNFSTNVNFGSSQYFRNTNNYENVINPANTLQNTLSSNITYTKRFTNLPIDFSLSLNHNQNVNTQKIDLNLPEFNLNLSRVYPFSKNGRKQNALEKINLTYKMNALDKISTTDSLLLTSALWEGSRMGVKQYIPISTNMKLFKYFNLQPSINYTEVWLFQSVEKYWDATANNGVGEVITTEKKGFNAFRNIDFSASLSTSLYGTFLFGEQHKIKGIRQTTTPSLSYGYAPIDHAGYTKTYLKLNEEISYSTLENSIYGLPRMNESKSLSLNVSNQFEAKIKSSDKKDKKIRFLNANFNYNFLKDSLQMSNITLSSSQKITEGLQVNINSSFDLYAVDGNGQNINKLAIGQGQGLGHFKNLNLTSGYNFSNKTFKKKEKKTNRPNIDSPQETTQKEITLDAFNNPIIWNLNVSYTFNYNNKAYAPLSNLLFDEISTHTLNFTGNVKFSENWNMRFITGYDLVNMDFTKYNNFTFTRELKSWQMSFTWSPSKNYTSWYFNIGIKSSMLQGIKYDKRNEPFTRFF